MTVTVNIYFIYFSVLKGKILSIDWERDQRTTAAPTTQPTTTRPLPTLPTPEDGETDLVIGRKPDQNLINIFKTGKSVQVSEEDFLAEPAMFPFFKPKIIRVELEKLFKGIQYLPRERGHHFNIRFSSMHRTPYEVGKKYLLTGFAAGEELTMNDCNWFSEWRELSKIMHQGIRREYWMYCGCRIKNCFYGPCKPSRRQCGWKIDFKQVGHQRDDFFSRQRICMVQYGVRCGWCDPNDTKCYRR